MERLWFLEVEAVMLAGSYRQVYEIALNAIIRLASLLLLKCFFLIICQEIATDTCKANPVECADMQNNARI